MASKTTRLPPYYITTYTGWDLWFSSLNSACCKLYANLCRNEYMPPRVWSVFIGLVAVHMCKFLLCHCCCCTCELCFEISFSPLHKYKFELWVRAQATSQVPCSIIPIIGRAYVAWRIEHRQQSLTYGLLPVPPTHYSTTSSCHSHPYSLLWLGILTP